MATPNASKYTFSEICEAIPSRIDKIYLPVCGDLDQIDHRKVRINKNAYSGFVSDAASGSCRGESASFSSKIVIKLLTKIKEQKYPSKDIWKFTVKPKANRLTMALKELKARPIALCDDVLVRIAGYIAQDITDKLSFCPRSEIFLGRSLDGADFVFIEELLVAPGRKYACPDFSQYDNYNYEELMVSACGILEQLYIKKLSCLNYFFYIASSVVDKHIIVEPGVLYKIMKGLPSGHPFTSLINTLCN